MRASRARISATPAARWYRPAVLGGGLAIMIAAVAGCGGPSPKKAGPATASVAASPVAAASSAPATGQLVSRDFTVTIPAGWTRSIDPNGNGYDLRAPDGGILIVPETGSPTHSSAALLGRDGASALRLHKYLVKHPARLTTVAGAPAFEIASLDPSGKNAVLNVGIVHGGKYYVMTFLIPAAAASSTPDTGGLNTVQQSWRWR